MVSNVDYTDLVTITVGDSETAFKVHKDVLIKSSKFFRAKYSPEWTPNAPEDAVTDPLHIPDVDCKSFSSYVQWAYSGKIDSATTLPDGTKLTKLDSFPSPFKALVVRQHTALVHLALFADQLNAPALLNQVVDEMVKVIDVTGWLPEVEAISLAWENLPESSGLKRMLVRFVAANLKREEIRVAKDNELFPEEFFFDLLMCYKDCLDEDIGLEFLERPTYENACEYHEHGEGIPTCITEVDRGTIDVDSDCSDDEDVDGE